MLTLKLFRLLGIPKKKRDDRFIGNCFISGGKEGSLPNREIRSHNGYYDLVTERAATRALDVSHSTATTLLSQFVESKCDSSRLRGFLYSKEDAEPVELGLHDYFVILKMCKILELRDLDLVSSLSEKIRLCFISNYKHGSGTSRSFKVDESNVDTHECDPGTPGVSSYDCNTGNNIPFMEAVRTVCHLYNELKILYDPLFKTIGNICMDHRNDITNDDVALLLQTYAVQNYRDHRLIGHLSSYVQEQVNDLSIAKAVSIYKSMGHLDVAAPELSRKLEARFCEELDVGDNVINFRFHDALKVEELVNIGYTKFIQGFTDNGSFFFVKGILEAIINKKASVEAISPKQRRKITILVAFLKCLCEPCYNNMEENTRTALREMITSENDYKMFNTTKFVDKVSEHLTKLRIRHETKVYINGILLDIVEKPQNMVWLCNSYHRFYAMSFDLTCERKALERLIRAFGFKICPINYYQWGRMKAKRTRFAYIRMARYYAINDQRQYDHRYAGWSLPYVWWNVSRQEQMHISNYIKYEP